MFYIVIVAQEIGTFVETKILVGRLIRQSMSLCKCTYASKSSIFFEKQIDLSIEYGIHIHDKSLLVRVKSEWHIQNAKPYFSKKCECAGVCPASCERTFEVRPTSVGGVLEITKNIPNLQVFGSKKFDYILCI